MTYTKREYTLVSEFDGTILSGLMVAAESPFAIVQLAHGMAEHKERYLPFMEYLAERGFACFLHDHRGHGGSVKDAAQLGYFGANGAEGVVCDLHQSIQYATAHCPDLPVYLFGHSMGSLVVRCYLKNHEQTINGLIVCGTPAKNPAAAPGVLLCRLIGAVKGEHHRSPLLQSMTTGPFDKPFAGEGLKNSWLTRDKAVVNAYNADPLCGFTFTVNGYRGLLELMGGAYSPMQAKNPRLPVHFLSGEDDPCHGGKGGFEKAVAAMAKNGWTQISQKLYPSMRHEVLNELEREQVYRDLYNTLMNWVKQR